MDLITKIPEKKSKTQLDEAHRSTPDPSISSLRWVMDIYCHFSLTYESLASSLPKLPLLLVLDNKFNTIAWTI